MPTESRPSTTTECVDLEKDDASGLPNSSQSLVKVDELVKAQRSSMEEDLMRNALAFMKTSEAKWHDARSQGGPSPSDFGEHDPIPVDAVCATVVTMSKEN